MPRPLSLPLPRRLRRHLPDLLTAARGACAVGVGAAAVGRLRRGARGPWPRSVVAALALCEVADGLDGRLARRLGVATARGAVLDAETDAVTMVALSLALRATGAPAWVLVPGALRYAYGVAVLARGGVRLPERGSRRVCAAVGASALIAALAADRCGWPVARDAAAGAGLAVLGASFALDVPALLGAGGSSGPRCRPDRRGVVRRRRGGRPGRQTGMMGA